MSPKKQDPQPPTEVTREAGVRALLSDIFPGESPLTHEQIETCRTTCLKGSTPDADGVPVFTYTFNPPKPKTHWLGWGDSAKSYEAPNQALRDITRNQMARLEEITNIRFKESPPGEEAKACLGILAADVLLSDTEAYAERRGDMRLLVIDKTRGVTDSTVMHEIMHGLGFSHPSADKKGMKSGGDNPLYSADSTIMSYNPGKKIFASPGLSYLDVTALHLIFGEPKKPIYPDIIKPTVLSDKRYLYDTHPLTLDIRGIPLGILTIDDKEITGHFYTNATDVGDIKKMTLVGTYMVYNSQLKDVLADNNTDTYLTLTGNDLPNRLQGGAAEDILTPRGGNDTLTGNGGHNTFIIDGKSGFNNVITDYDTVPKIDKSIRSAQETYTAPKFNAGSAVLKMAQETLESHQKLIDDNKNADDDTSRKADAADSVVKTTREQPETLHKSTNADKPVDIDKLLYDLHLPENRLNFKAPIAKIELNYCDAFTVQGRSYKGTQVHCMDEKGNAVASIIVADITPERLEADILNDHTYHPGNLLRSGLLPQKFQKSRYEGPSINIDPTLPEPDSTQHPSGLPFNFGGLSPRYKKPGR